MAGDEDERRRQEQADAAERRLQDEVERRQKEGAAPIQNEETGESDLVKIREERLAKNKKVEHDFHAEIKRMTSLSQSSITKLTDEIFLLIVEKEEIIAEKENALDDCQSLIENMEKRQFDLENEVKHFQTAPASLDENFDVEGSSDKTVSMVSFLAENDIESVEELEAKLLELHQLKRERKLFMNFQSRATVAPTSIIDNTNLRRAEAEMQKLQKQLKLREHQNKELEEVNKKMVDDYMILQEENQKKMESLSESFSERENARAQRTDRTLNEFPALDDSELSERKPEKPFYHTRWNTGTSPEMSMFAMMQQIETEKCLPNPPKFSARDNTTSLETFKRTFLMKFGRLSNEQQVTLLEASFLEGKALKVFQSIPEYEKESFESVMFAMSERLRVSECDEARRAKNRWEQLAKNESETVEDFSLRIDELAKRAFVGIPSKHVASMKIAKLLKALANNESMAAAIDDKLDSVSTEDQYEVARKKAIRMERAAKEREGIRQKERGDDKEKKDAGDGRQTQNQMNSQASKNSWPPKQNQNQNYRQHFNSPSNNYQANPSNKNFQFSLSNQGVPLNPSYQFSQSPPVMNQFVEPNQSSQLSQGKGIPEENKSVSIEQQRQVNENGAGVKIVGCEECQQAGCHATNCSKAPRGPRVCYKCQEVGHFARNCPKQYQSEVQSNIPRPNNVITISSIETVRNDSPPNEVNSSESEDTSALKYETGKVAGVETKFMIDSGAVISLMSKNLWNQIVEVKGRCWEKALRKEKSEIRVVAVNDSPIDVLFQVVLESAVGCRTRKIPLYVADINRKSVILGINNFEAMGIRLSIDSMSDKEMEYHRVDHVISEYGQERVEGSSEDEAAKGTAEESATKLRDEKHSGNAEKAYTKSDGNNDFYFQSNVQNEERSDKGETDSFGTLECRDDPDAQNQVNERSGKLRERIPLEDHRIQKFNKPKEMFMRSSKFSSSFFPKPGLKKEGEVACGVGVTFNKITTSLPSEEKARLKSDPSMDMAKDCVQTRFAQFHEEYRPRKHPPHAPNRGSSDSCTGKSSPKDTSKSPDTNDVYLHQEYRPRKDPPNQMSIQYGQSPRMEHHTSVNSTSTWKSPITIL